MNLMKQVRVVVCTALLAAPCWGTESLPVSARILTEEELVTLVGGGHECGCEVEAEHCADVSFQQGNCPGNSACVICSANGQREKCADWGLCWGSSCSDCVVDEKYDCGIRQIGYCGDTGCEPQLNQGECEDAFRCHTVGGW